MFIHYLVVLTLLTSVGSAQMLTNYVGTDCNGQQHNFFQELDEGKIIVMCWVMPCGFCTGPALTSYNIVKSYQERYPEKVVFYLVDDYANTNCSGLDVWANQYNITKSAYSTRFSSKFINMTDYGTVGMPKVVILGGADHRIYYNANNDVEPDLMVQAIDDAIKNTTSVNERAGANSLRMSIHPNPASNALVVSLELQTPSDFVIEFVSVLGAVVHRTSSHSIHAGQQNITVFVSDIPAGLYFVRVHSGEDIDVSTCVITH